MLVLICFLAITACEGEGYYPDDNDRMSMNHTGPDNLYMKSRRSLSKKITSQIVGHDFSLSKEPMVNSFHYGLHLARTQYIPTFYADADIIDTTLWWHIFAGRENGNLPFVLEGQRSLFGKKSLHLSLDEAAATYQHLLTNGILEDKRGSILRSPLYRWNEFIKYRDRVAVNTLGRMTLEFLGPTPPANRLRVLGYYGIKHQGGIEDWMRVLGFPFTSHIYDTPSQRFMPVQRYYSPKEHHKYIFIKDYFWHHTAHGKYTGLQKDNFAQTIYETPLARLENIYDGYRFAMDAALSLRAGKSTKITQITRLREELALLLREALESSFKARVPGGA